MAAAFYFYRKYPDTNQGFKTKMKTKLVKKEMLEGFLKGKSLLSISKEYGCTPSTVKRAVKSFQGGSKAKQVTVEWEAKKGGTYEKVQLLPLGRDKKLGR